MTIPLYALTFVKGEIAFGGFLSFLGLIGVIATLIVTRFSDKQHKRMKFLFPLLIFYAFFIFLLFFADNLITWLVFTALLSITQIIIYPFFFAVVLDKIQDKALGMVMREFMLNAGRVFGVGAVIVLLYVGLPLQYAFLASSIFPLMYLSLLLIKKTYIEEAYYPLSPVVKVYDKSKNLVGKAYSWGKVVTIKEFHPKDVTARVYTGTTWVTVSLKNLSKQAFNKILKGEVAQLKKLKQRRKNI